MQALSEIPFAAGVFSAAVADYRTESVFPGKTPCTSPISLRLVPTEKIISAVKTNFPELHIVAFKYQESISHQDLMAIAHKRIQAGYPLVVANRGEEKGPHGEQVAHLVTNTGEAQRAIGKPAIALAIADYLEQALTTTNVRDH